MRLSEWQNRFIDALVVSEKQHEFIELVGPSLASRIEIYHGSVQQALVNTLRNTYPHTVGILGDDCFNQFAQQYAKHHPMTAVNLNFYGESFPEFLGNALMQSAQRMTGFAGFEYLADFAALEWCCHRAYYAADKPECQPISEMSSLDGDAQMNVSLQLAADISLLKSDYPLHRVWNKLTDVTQVESLVKERDEGQNCFHYLIRRQGYRGQPMQVSVADYQLLTMLRQDTSLGALMALEADLSPLADYISKQWLVGFRVKVV